MCTRNAMRMVVMIASLAAVPVAAVAQAQNQAPPNQPQNQAQPNQQAQPQPKKSFWQKMREATQGAQNAMQQGANTVQNTVQQGTSTVQGTVQNGAGVMQNGVQQVQGGAQPGMQGPQQGAQFPAANGNPAAGFNAGGAGSCGPSCFDAGPFQANVSQMTMSQQGYWHIIRMTIQFHNSTSQPLIVAYHEGSMVMVDNNGATYIPAGGNPGELQGMGIDRGNQTDSQFVLNPGQTGNALFSVARSRGNDSPVGTAYSYNFSIDELQPQNGAMALVVRTYNLNFPSLAPSSVSNTASFPSASSPAMGFAGSNPATGSGYTAVPQGNLQAQPGVAVPRQAQRMVNGRPVAATTGYAAQQSTVPARPGVALPGQAQRIVNGRPLPAMPPAVNNAALRSTVTTARAPVAAAKPSPARVAAKAATPAAPKKPATPAGK